MAANDEYREYLRRMMACTVHQKGTTALGKVLSSKLAFAGPGPTDEDYEKVLTAAGSEFGGGLVVGLHFAYLCGSWQAVAVYKNKEGLLVVERRPARFTYARVVVGMQTLDVGKDEAQPLLFRLTAWLARSVFTVHDAKPFPVLHQLAVNALHLPETKACLNTRYGMAELLTTMDVSVTSVALQTTQLDAEDASAVDVLHCFGLVYVGSLNEATSDEEGVHLRATMALAKIQEGADHIWWVEDYTVFETDHFNLVFRFNIEDRPMYMKRRMVVCGGGKRFKDLQTDSLSGFLRWEPEEPEAGIVAFDAWVRSLLPSGSKTIPYMRHEIIKRYDVLLPKRFLFMVRPFLVKGLPGFVPSYSTCDLPARLYYSPDLFVEREKIPQGCKPTTVLAEIMVKPCMMASCADVQLFLRVDGEADNVYRILFRKDGEVMPEASQVRIFVQSQDRDSFGEDTLQLVVLRRDIGPGGSMLVEFILTSYCRPFTLCTDSMLADFSIKWTTFVHDANVEPVVFPRMDLCLWSNFCNTVAEKHRLSPSKAAEVALKRVTQKTRCMVPLVFAKRYMEHFYSFHFYNGDQMAKLRPCFSDKKS